MLSLSDFALETVDNFLTVALIGKLDRFYDRKPGKKNFNSDLLT